jgi:isoquinoline 1-oxidoreductase subunit alpha
MIALQINGGKFRVDVEPDMPLLWVLRDVLLLRGTKYGCGIGQCGACLVHIDGEPAYSCVVPVSDAAEKKVLTIEGLSVGGPHPLQRAWIDLQVPQCGYCQPGMLMAAAALLKKTPQPTDADIDTAVPNICRCGTYARVREAIHAAAKATKA